ncbi:MAG: lipopolysaccharide heptosyltransferase II [Proteobacteria bacterium]|nr:lipopolysaccharide heptosyltransferase II [Pseudomonadota bacterium]
MSNIVESSKKILVRVPNWIGDAVMALPALEALATLYPEATISVLAKAVVMPIFENNPAVAEIIEYKREGEHKGLGGRRRLARELRERGFNMAVLFQNAFDAAFIVRLARIPIRVGYARDFRSRLLTHPIEVTDEITARHQVFYYLHLVETLGLPPVSTPPLARLYVSEEEHAWVDGFSKDAALGTETLIGVAPGASYGPAKEWPAENFAAVLNYFAKKQNALPVLFGGPGDVETSRAVSKAVTVKDLNVTSRLSLRQFMALLPRVGVFITNDSGAMHIASALGVPTVAIFGSTEPKSTGPLSKNSIVLRVPLECSPCFERTCSLKHYNCLREITPEAVIEAAEKLMTIKDRQEEPATNQVTENR